ncbi:MAG: hypothetical protein RSF40_04905 [Oscillospiraceae bacterium]
MAEYVVRDGETIYDVGYNANGSLYSLDDNLSMNDIDTYTPSLNAGAVITVSDVVRNNDAVISANNHPFNSSHGDDEEINAEVMSDLNTLWGSPLNPIPTLENTSRIYDIAISDISVGYTLTIPLPQPVQILTTGTTAIISNQPPNLNSYAINIGSQYVTSISFSANKKSMTVNMTPLGQIGDFESYTTITVYNNSIQFFFIEIYQLA